MNQIGLEIKTGPGVETEPAPETGADADSDSGFEETDSQEADSIDSYGIVLPADWMRIPLDDGFEAFVREQRSRLATDGRLSKTAQRQFELMLRQLRNDCQRADVSLAAALISVIAPDAGPDDDASGQTMPNSERADLLSATCTISSLSRSTLGSELPLTVNSLAAALARIPDPDDGTEVVNLEAPTITEVSAGDAVKTVRLVTLPPEPVTRQRPTVFTQHFFVPYDSGQRSAVVSFASPTPAYARQLSSLFDAMMSTFRMFGGDDPTDPLAPSTSSSAESQT